jgi:hypothetical protein
MSFGIVVLTVVGVWSLLSVLVSVTLGGIARDRDIVSGVRIPALPAETTPDRHVAA